MAFTNQYLVFAAPSVFGFNYPTGFFIDNIFSQDFTKIKSGVTFSNEFSYKAPYDVWISNIPYNDSALVSTIPLSIGNTSSIYSVIVGDQGPQGPTGPTTLVTGTATYVAYFDSLGNLTGDDGFIRDLGTQQTKVSNIIGNQTDLMIVGTAGPLAGTWFGITSSAGLPDVINGIFNDGSFVGLSGPAGVNIYTNGGYKGGFGVNAYKTAMQYLPSSGTQSTLIFTENGVHFSSKDSLLLDNQNKKYIFNDWKIDGKTLYYGVTNSIFRTDKNLILQDDNMKVGFYGATQTFVFGSPPEIGQKLTLTTNDQGYFTLDAYAGFTIYSNYVPILQTALGFGLGVNGADARTTFRVNFTGTNNLFGVYDNSSVQRLNITSGGIQTTNTSLIESNIKQINTASYSLTSNDYILNVKTGSTIYLPQLTLGIVYWIYGDPVGSYGITISSTYSTYFSSAGATYSTRFSNQNSMIIRAVDSNYWFISELL
jgi:hypothetical protein